MYDSVKHSFDRESIFLILETPKASDFFGVLLPRGPRNGVRKE